MGRYFQGSSTTGRKIIGTEHPIMTQIWSPRAASGLASRSVPLAVVIKVLSATEKIDYTLSENDKMSLLLWEIPSGTLRSSKGATNSLLRLSSHAQNASPHSAGARARSPLSSRFPHIVRHMASSVSSLMMLHVEDCCSAVSRDDNEARANHFSWIWMPSDPRAPNPRIKLSGNRGISKTLLMLEERIYATSVVLSQSSIVLEVNIPLEAEMFDLGSLGRVFSFR